jgi:hypothetical protein
MAKGCPELTDIPQWRGMMLFFLGSRANNGVMVSRILGSLLSGADQVAVFCVVALGV